MLAAKSKGEPPPELIQRHRCRAWGLAPKAGGMNEQDYIDIHRMDVLESVDVAVRQWRNGKPGGMIDWLAREGLM